MSKITKAVIAVAGYGTRFLPATKSIPKEMLPIVDKPAIQYLVEEAVLSGIKDIIFVTRSGQTSLEDHFDNNIELELVLKNSKKQDLLKKIQKLNNLANFIYVRQDKKLPYGNATPLISVKNLISENESFAYMFGDDMVMSKEPCIRQLINKWKNKNYSPIIAVQEVAKEEVERYGIIRLKNNTEDEMQDAIEKPSIQEAPSNLAQFGRFILNREMINIAYDNYRNNKLGKDQELWLIDIIKQYNKNNPVYIKRIEGKWMTTGDPLRFLQTSIKYALERKDIAKDLKTFLKEDLKI